MRKRYLRRPDASDERGANKIKLQRQLVIYADWAKADPKTSKNELKLNRILFMRKALEYIYEFNEFPVDPKTGKTLVKRGPDGKLLFPWQKGFGE
ncbi:MAG: hypothetical protein U1C71_00745 [archaeon]|nr:hypothetical protein [archaeon]